MTDADCPNDKALLANTPARAKSLLHSLKQVSEGIGLCVNANEAPFMNFKQKVAIYTLSDKQLK